MRAANTGPRTAVGQGGAAHSFFSSSMPQVLLTVCFIAPVVSMWIPFLGGLRLHWAKATAVDQVLIGRS